MILNVKHGHVFMGNNKKNLLSIVIYCVSEMLKTNSNEQVQSLLFLWVFIHIIRVSIDIYNILSWSHKSFGKLIQHFFGI